MDKVTRKESSIPVQGRISVVDLANMDRYWAVREGISIKSMSQLLSWTFTAMCDVIKANGKMPEEFKSVAAANNYLTGRGLYQKSMKKKGQSRIIAAMGFESLRSQGRDPARDNEVAYNTIHSEQTVGVYDGEVDIEQPKMPSSVDVNDMVSKIREDKKKAEDYRQKELNDAINSNMIVDESKDETSIKEGMSDEELLRDRQEKDKEIAERENAPVRAEDFDLT